jgi:hypothetical protein
MIWLNAWFVAHNYHKNLNDHISQAEKATQATGLFQLTSRGVFPPKQGHF